MFFCVGIHVGGGRQPVHLLAQGVQVVGHGLPWAARPIMMASAPVAASTARAFSGLVMSPLATTGTRTAAFTAAMVSYSACPL